MVSNKWANITNTWPSFGQGKVNQIHRSAGCIGRSIGYLRESTKFLHWSEVCHTVHASCPVVETDEGFGHTHTIMHQVLVWSLMCIWDTFRPLTFKIINFLPFHSWGCKSPASHCSNPRLWFHMKEDITFFFLKKTICFWITFMYKTRSGDGPRSRPLLQAMLRLSFADQLQIRASTLIWDSEVTV